MCGGSIRPVQWRKELLSVPGSSAALFSAQSPWATLVQDLSDRDPLSVVLDLEVISRQKHKLVDLM